jgi:hypothetical protein
MKKLFKVLLFSFAIAAINFTISCDELGEECTGCPDDAPYGALDGGCYATLSECEDAESGNCVICQ